LKPLEDDLPDLEAFYVKGVGMELDPENVNNVKLMAKHNAGRDEKLNQLQKKFTTQIIMINPSTIGLLKYIK